MPLQWRNFFWQSLEEGAGKLRSELETNHIKPSSSPSPPTKPELCGNLTVNIGPHEDLPDVFSVDDQVVVGVQVVEDDVGNDAVLSVSLHVASHPVSTIHRACKNQSCIASQQDSPCLQVPVMHSQSARFTIPARTGHA